MSKRDIPLEKTITRGITEMLKKEPGVWFFKVFGNGTQAAGIPDIIACVDGRFVALEIKRPEIGRLTDLQAMMLERIRAAGGYAEVVTSVEDVRKAIRQVTDFRVTQNAQY